MNNNADENAKNPAFKVPTDLPHAKPQDYDVSINSERGSDRNLEGQSAIPDRKEISTRKEKNG